VNARESGDHTVDKKKLGSTVLGWFVTKEDADGNPVHEPDPEPELEPEPEPERAPPPRRRAAMPIPAPLPPDHAPPSIRRPMEVPVVTAGTAPSEATYTQVYRAAQITQEDQERFEKAKSLLETLPAETPKEVKRQIVEASLKAFTIPVEQIIETGVEQIQALESYIQHGARHTQDVLTEAQARIEKLQSDVVEIRKLMELQVKTQNDLARACNTEKLKAQSVLEFFGQEAVARVVKASPKLVEPGH
jgi:hypothetical protein